MQAHIFDSSHLQMIIGLCLEDHDNSPEEFTWGHSNPAPTTSQRSREKDGLNADEDNQKSNYQVGT